MSSSAGADPILQLIELRKMALQIILDSTKDDPVERVRLMSEEMRGCHADYQQVLRSSDEKIKKRSLTSAQMVDIGFFYREDESLLDDWRKDAKSRSELCGKIVAYERITSAESDPDSAEDIVRGKYATAKVKSEIQPKIPNRSSKEYYDACELLGVPREVAEKGVVKLDFNRAREYVTSLVAEGGEIPKALSDTYPVFGCTYIRRR